MPLDREAFAQAAGPWKGPTGEPLLLATMYFRRCVADLFYLGMVRQVGAQAAGEVTCAKYGHESRGQTCQRCGQSLR